MGYSEWGQWSVSLAECGSSVIKRKRECINENGCNGDDTHNKTIYLDPCPGREIILRLLLNCALISHI